MSMSQLLADKATHEFRRTCGKLMGQSLLKKANTLVRAEDHAFAAYEGTKIYRCATNIKIYLNTTPQHGTRLYVSNDRSCKSRLLCPFCQHLHAIKNSSALAALFPVIWEICPTAQALFLGLGTKNRDFTDVGLSGMYEDHVAGLDAFFKLPRVRDMILGQFTAIEVAVRKHNGIYYAGVHSHSIPIVDRTKYFASGTYAISQPEWANLWREACKLDYHPVVDIRLAKDKGGGTTPGALRSAAVEAAKYAVKPFFEHDSGTISVNADIALTIARVLKGKRLHRYDRIYTQAKSILRARKQNHAPLF
jgi:plasmid rolling circle replication initiator protein Rep